MSNNLLWKPYAPEYVRDPYSMYKILRDQDPIHKAQTKEYIITKYDDVKTILKSSSFDTGNRLEWLNRGIKYLANKDEDFTAIYAAMNSFILMLNSTNHIRIRSFVSKTWNDKDVDAIILKNINDLIPEISSEFDLVSSFTQPLSVRTACNILGLETDEYNYLKDLAISMTKTLDLYISYKDLISINDSAVRFISFFSNQIKIKSDKPDKGLLSKLIQKNKLEHLGLTEEELVSLAIFLFIAGEETSASLISSGIYNLLLHPDQLNLLQSNPDLITSAVDELLRYDSVVQLLGRISKEDYKIGEMVIPAQSTVTLVLGSANRDETIFAEPNALNITRNPNRHLSFGSGVHFCLGDWLAKRQAQLAIGTFFQKFPNAKLMDKEVGWYNNLAIRSLKSLPVQTQD